MRRSQSEIIPVVTWCYGPYNAIAVAKVVFALVGPEVELIIHYVLYTGRFGLGELVCPTNTGGGRSTEPLPTQQVA